MTLLKDFIFKLFDSEICYWISLYKAWQTDHKWRDALRIVIPSERLCVEFYILCSLKWVALSQNAVKLTFQRLCELLQWQDAFWLPNCLLNEIVVIFSGHLVLHLPTSCQWFWRLQVIWELHEGEHVICSLQLNLRLTRPVIYLNTMESIFRLFLLKIPLVFKEYLKWDVSLH